MDQSNYCWMPCKIENSGFSSERRFEVDLPGDGGRVVGAAYIEHFRDRDKKELSEGHPPYGQVMTGFVRCRIMRRSADKASIEFPGTEVFHVPFEAIADQCRLR